MIEQWDAFASDLLRLRREHNVTTEEGQQVTGEARFTLVSWNIQGLGGDEPLNEVLLRTEVAMRELLALAPTLICLQEVVPETVETIEGMLGGRYLDVECFDLETVVTWTVRGLVEAHVEAHGHYFTKMFVSQRAIFANGLTVNAVSRFRFPSQQGRDLLFVTLEHKGKRMCVATTHLESGRDRISVDLRHRQLQYCLQKIDTHSVQRTQDLFLLVGDMNLGHLDNSENHCAFGHQRSYSNQKMQNPQLQSMIRITRRLSSADAASFMAAGILLYRYSVENKNLELLMGTGRSGRLSILGGKKEGSAGPVDTAIREFDEETGQVISLSALKSLSSTIANSDVSSDSILTCYYPGGKYVLYLVNVDAVPALRGATSDVTTTFDKFIKRPHLRNKKKATSEFLEMSSLDWVDLNTILARLSAFGSGASAIRGECGLNEFAALIFKCPALRDELSNIKRRQGAEFESGTALRQAANTAASESESTDEDDAALEAEVFLGAGLSIQEITQGWDDADLRPTWDAGTNKRVLKMLDNKDDEQMRPRDPQNKKKKNRFDRCYFKIRGFLTSEEATAAKLAWKFCGASLIGTNTNSLLEQSDHELTRSGYVSDHYGLYLDWQVSEKHMVKAKESLKEQEKRLAREKRRLSMIKERLEMKAKALKDAERKKFLQNCALSS
jgi:8-oxo-dGTP pyrophosphatase MutT (NUDIX family)